MRKKLLKLLPLLSVVTLAGCVSYSYSYTVESLRF